MGTEPLLHVAFFPFMAHGHMIPTLDIAKLFAARGVRTTIITTPLNAPTFTNTQGAELINIEIFTFPAKEAGLPEGCENLDQVTASLLPLFNKAASMLQDPLEHFLDRTHPDCLVADMFFPWATESASKFNIPRLVFHGTSYFSLCVGEIVRLYEPYNDVSSDEEPFVLPHLPHEVKMTRSQIPGDFWKNTESEFKKTIKVIKESELTCYGVLVNSFYELEPEYAEFYTKELGRRAWHIGPASLCNTSIEDKAWRGKQASLDQQECLNWLGSKKPNSVIYISFGSTANIITPQLNEIALALEASGLDFIWVVRKGDRNYEDSDWLPSGFEQRLEGKGLIIRGWAPQVLILAHEAIGAFVTHCGWNSTLEGVSAGLPMVTWPACAEQFYNEKLVTTVWKIGVSVGAKRWTRVPSVEDVVKHDAIEKAMKQVMEGEERRNTAKKFKEMARKAVEQGGSSDCDITNLINELRSHHHA